MQLHNRSFPIKQRLPIHEWMAVVVIIAFLFALTFFSNYSSSTTLQTVTTAPHHLTNPLIDITIEGAVKYPGTFQVKKGTPIQEVLASAEPLPNANLKKLKLNGKATRRRKIKIPTK